MINISEKVVAKSEDERKSKSSSRKGVTLKKPVLKKSNATKKAVDKNATNKDSKAKDTHKKSDAGNNQGPFTELEDDKIRELVKR